MAFSVPPARRTERRTPVEGNGSVDAGAVSAGSGVGCYVYCILPRTAHEDPGLACRGLDGARVYAVSHRDLTALVHDCPPRPYRSEDGATAAEWVLAHHRTIETAFHALGAALPMAFNTIVAPSADRDARQNLVSWLETEHDVLRMKLDALRGKVEYELQVLWDTPVVLGRIARDAADVRRLEEEAKGKPRGLAYLYGQRVEKLLKQEMERRASELFKAVYARASCCADRVRSEDRGNVSGSSLKTIVGLSCLVARERSAELRAMADEFSRQEGYSVRFVGPLPPYSFC